MHVCTCTMCAHVLCAHCVCTMCAQVAIDWHVAIGCRKTVKHLVNYYKVVIVYIVLYMCIICVCGGGWLWGMHEYVVGIKDR